jgi:peptidyl-prolyl cis-trans isomerase SurA
LKILRGAGLWLALMLGVAGAAPAQRLDGVAAVVNDDVVLESDVEEQLYIFLQRAGVQPDSAEIDTLRSQVLNQLIDEKLIVAEAKRQGITVSDAEVNKQVEQAIAEARQRLGGDAAFAEQLRRENLTLDALRQKYKSEVQRQMTAQKLVQKQIPRRPVPQAEAEAYFKANPSKFPKMPAEVQVSVIQIPPTADSAAAAKALATAREARKRILGGEKFAKVAAELSEDPTSARSGGDLGFFTSGSMEPAFEKAAFSQPLNQVSEPVRTLYGWHLIETLERDVAKTRAGADSVGPDGQKVLEAHVRHILIRVQVGEADVERARALAERVRGEAARGTNFGTLVRRYSQYQGTQTEDGDIGFVSMGSLQPQIRAALDTLEVGDISPVLTNQAGFNIFKVTDRRPEREYTLEEIRDELPEAVAQMRFREQYEAWVKTLRGKAHIEIRKA